MRPVMIDTDIGDDIDDALALALALRSPELDVRGVSTVFGDTAQRARLARKLLVTFGRPDIPVAEGLRLPLARRHRPSGCIQGAAVAPDEALPPLYAGSAVDLLCEQALAHPGEITIIAQGPLTNIASALRVEPRLASALAGIVMMGSSAFPWAEWNTRCDPEAFRVVLRSGVPLTLVGLNVTLPCRLALADVRAMAAAGRPETEFLSRCVALWQRGNARRRPVLHDPLAVATVACPQLVTLALARPGNLLEGPLRGWSCALPWPAGRARAAVVVRRAAFLRLFVARVVEARSLTL